MTQNIDQHGGVTEEQAGRAFLCTLVTLTFAMNLVARGVPVAHIFSEKERRPHELTKGARLEGAEVTYPGLHEEPRLPLS